MREKTCAGCDHYGDEKLEYAGKIWSTCRGDLPRVRQIGSADAGLTSPGPLRGEFPHMPSDGWCAHWVPKERTDEAAAGVVPGIPTIED